MAAGREKQPRRTNLQTSTRSRRASTSSALSRKISASATRGFYAATKRKVEVNGGDYEPTLTAATKNLGDRVAISIRDNGIGPRAKRVWDTWDGSKRHRRLKRIRATSPKPR